MSRLLPVGFLTVRQAADEFAVAMYSGVPDRPDITKARQDGVDVADGAALQNAIEQLWTFVDDGKLELFLIGPSNSKPIKLPADWTHHIPLLRSTRGGTIAFLRPGNWLYRQMVSWFGQHLFQVSVVFQESEIQRLTRTTLRARRRQSAVRRVGTAGRPSRQAEAKRIISTIIEDQRWSPTKSLKALTQEVNRRSRELKPFSVDTVTRALDDLYGQTKDRRFERLAKRKQHPSSG